MSGSRGAFETSWAASPEAMRIATRIVPRIVWMRIALPYFNPAVQLTTPSSKMACAAEPGRVARMRTGVIGSYEIIRGEWFARQARGRRPVRISTHRFRDQDSSCETGGCGMSRPSGSWLGYCCFGNATCLGRRFRPRVSALTPRLRSYHDIFLRDAFDLDYFHPASGALHDPDSRSGNLCKLREKADAFRVCLTVHRGRRQIEFPRIAETAGDRGSLRPWMDLHRDTRHATSAL